MGLLVNIYKDSSSNYDCTAGGASSRNIKGFCLTDCEGPFEPSEEYPAATINKRLLCGEYHYRIVPVQQYRDGEPVERKGVEMFGGNYACTSDSRFPHDYPLPIHDRIE